MYRLAIIRLPFSFLYLDGKLLIFIISKKHDLTIPTFINSCIP